MIQGLSTLVVAVHLAIVILIISMNRLSVPLLLLLSIVEYALLAIAITPRLLRDNRNQAPNGEGLPHESFTDVIAEYWAYCKPLVAYSVVGFGYHFADRWLLQRFGVLLTGV